MNKEQKESYLYAMTEYLKKRRRGYRTTPLRLFTLACRKEKKELTDSEMLELSCDLYRYAEKQGLLLDCKFNNGEPVGLPYNISFYLYHKKPGVRCPFCGSRDTADIGYGFPANSITLAVEEDEHRIYLGGCLPRRRQTHCFRCKEDFGFHIHPDRVASVHFELIPGRRMPQEVTITNKDGVCFANSLYGGKKPLSRRQWKHITESLFYRFSIEEWEPDCSGGLVMDGTLWTLDVTFGDGTSLTRKGDEMRFQRTEDLCRLFKPYLK